MRVVLRGIMSGEETYARKDSGEVVTQCFVASGKHMLPVRVPFSPGIPLGASVVVIGDLNIFGKDLYIKDGMIRPATQDDEEYFHGMMVDEIGHNGGKVINSNA